jgi:magnesium-transporting ATPase (P-type)
MRNTSEMKSAEIAWHAAAPEVAFERLQTSVQGLSHHEADQRLRMHGHNRLPQARRRSAFVRLLLQFHNLLIYVLLAAGVLAAAIGHSTDAVVIFAVVVVNAVIGFVQEGRAEEALEAIRGMIDPQASVMRDGRRTTIKADEVVPGDIVFLEAGDRVAADLRLVKARNLRVDEAILTGESVPVDKTTSAVDATAALGDRLSMVFSGTFVTAGQALGVVVATGAGTELGRISTLIGGVEQLTTPLVRHMDLFARQVTLAVLAVSALVFAYATLVHALAMQEAFMVVVGLAVAAIPEGLPAVMTITLAVGVQRMAQRNAIIRRLPAVETLGSVSVICSDKTGTLTRNEMMVGAVVVADRRIVVEGVGYRPAGGFRSDGTALDPAADSVLEELSLAALLCNDAQLRRRGDDWLVDGDPMEGALVSLAIKAGHDAAAARASFVRLDAIPFDSRHRYMATLHAGNDRERVTYVKGAPERILDMCSHVLARDGRRPIDRGAWHREVESLAADGQRVLGLARRSMDAHADVLSPPDVERDLTLLGLVGLMDPPRPEAVAAIAECKAAGIHVKMITGDHVATARAIARQLGLGDDPKAVTGRDLDEIPDAGFHRHAREATVFARTSPEHKLRLVESLQADGSVIAMTGDGVNDAPALKRADVGVAMGGKGTEAAKEASEMVLADDNFASIVAAVREGRTVYDNLTKVIAWTLPTNGGEAPARRDAARDASANPLGQYGHSGGARPHSRLRADGAGRHAATVTAGWRADTVGPPAVADTVRLHPDGCRDVRDLHLGTRARSAAGDRTHDGREHIGGHGDLLPVQRALRARHVALLARRAGHACCLDGSADGDRGTVRFHLPAAPAGSLPDPTDITRRRPGHPGGWCRVAADRGD